MAPRRRTGAIWTIGSDAAILRDYVHAFAGYGHELLWWQGKVCVARHGPATGYRLAEMAEDLLAFTSEVTVTSNSR